ncbi:MAG: hypothetical protein HW390_1284 [Candidatus Brocadiaceae bacterium]|nr:hypothetical protein [Candidatus Brocadiaceae bacterium]
MRSIFIATTLKRFSIFKYGKVLFLFVLMSACFASSLTAGQVGQASLPDITETSGVASPTKEELITKTKTLQMPFIANNGQVDEQVRFYAKTFGGTVFVTKDGEIVYSLPEGRGEDKQGSRGAGRHGQAPLVRADAELVVAHVYSPFLHAGNANCLPDRVFSKSLIAAYLPGLQKGTGNPQSERQNPKTPIRGVALKETIVGAKIGGITGEQPAVTTVNYFTGNDKSKWKTNVSTYKRVNLGEVYKGIELSLKAYSDNVEKLFCVKPGASPELIKVQLDGSKSLRVNQEGQLEADTELGLVKFTKPIAYQEIDGKRVGVDVEYRLSNPKSEIKNRNTVSPLPPTTKQKTSSSTPCWHPRSWVGLIMMRVNLLPSTPAGTYMWRDGLGQQTFRRRAVRMIPLLMVVMVMSLSRS